MRRKATKLELWSIAIAAFVMIILLPALNATPAGSFLHVSNFTINLYGKYLCYGLLAISVDLLWGYAGLREPAGAGVVLPTRTRLHDGNAFDADDW